MPVPTITSANTASGTAGQTFSYQIVATNSPTNYTAKLLPAGLNVNASTGLIEGYPQTAGSFAARLRAENGQGTSNEFTLTVTVAQEAADPITNPVASGLISAPTSNVYNAYGGGAGGSAAVGSSQVFVQQPDVSVGTTSTLIAAAATTAHRVTLAHPGGTNTVFVAVGKAATLNSGTPIYPGGSWTSDPILGSSTALLPLARKPSRLPTKMAELFNPVKGGVTSVNGNTGPSVSGAQAVAGADIAPNSVTASGTLTVSRADSQAMFNRPTTSDYSEFTFGTNGVRDFTLGTRAGDDDFHFYVQSLLADAIKITKTGNLTASGTVTAGGFSGPAGVAVGAYGFYTAGFQLQRIANNTNMAMFYSSDGSTAGNVSLGNLTASGDVEITDATKGVILKSPNGTRYRVTVANGGALSTTAL